VLHQNLQKIGVIMKAKLAQLLVVIKASVLYSFKIAKRCLKAFLQETIIVLQHLDTLLGE
jgi:hypothetical protein